MGSGHIQLTTNYFAIVVDIIDGIDNRGVVGLKFLLYITYIRINGYVKRCK